MDQPLADLIRSLEEQERLGVLNRDLAALERLWAEHLLVNNPANTVSPSRAAVLDRVRQGHIHYATFERTIEQMRQHGDVVIVMGGEQIQPAEGPQAGQTLRRRFSHVWQQQAGAWRLIARHANVIPAA